MRRAQGNTRSAPDGFLHLWNFAATKRAGMAGLLFNYLMNERMKQAVESALIERAEKQVLLTAKGSPEAKPEEGIVAHYRHETWRFRKEFLEVHFREVIYGTFKLFRKNASQLAAIEINREYLATDDAKVTFPTYQQTNQEVTNGTSI